MTFFLLGAAVGVAMCLAVVLTVLAIRKRGRRQRLDA
jgi:hypothetical protein